LFVHSIVHDGKTSDGKRPDPNCAPGADAYIGGFFRCGTDDPAGDWLVINVHIPTWGI